RLVSPYDEVLDRRTTEVHAQIVAFVAKMTATAGKPEGAYEMNRSFYSDLQGSIASLRARAASQPKNEITQKLVAELEGNVERLRQLHEMGKEGGLPKPLATPALAAIEVNCTSIIRFELAKRRGDQD